MRVFLINNDNMEYFEIHSRLQVKRSCIPFIDSFYNLAILGNFQKVDTPVSHVLKNI